MRKLASIQRITAINPIPGADKIVTAQVLGWSVVVGLNDGFKAGDLAVYFEIDSWLDASNPAFAAFEERFTNWGTKRGMRLKTIKLRKQISQGLLMPISAFTALSYVRSDGLFEGTDVTEFLGIEKWESLEDVRESNGPSKQAGTKQFPHFIRKTDQERVQNYINELGKHADETFEVTIKLDGSSMTTFHVLADSPWFEECVQDQRARALKRLSKWGRFKWNVKNFFGLVEKPTSIAGVTSRNVELPVAGDNHFSAYYRDHDLGTITEFIAQELDASVAVQGELIAPSIQGNYEKVSGYQWRVFDIFNIDTQTYLKPAEVRTLCAGLVSTVPVLLKDIKLSDFVLPDDPLTEDEIPRAIVDAILFAAEGPGMNNGVKREGIVFKSNESDFSFKAISNSYLLKKEGK